AREVRAAIQDVRVVALGKDLQQVLRAGRAQGALGPVVIAAVERGPRGSAGGQLLAQGAVEQIHHMRFDQEIGAQTEPDGGADGPGAHASSAVPVPGDGSDDRFRVACIGAGQGDSGGSAVVGDRSVDGSRARRAEVDELADDTGAPDSPYSMPITSRATPMRAVSTPMDSAPSRVRIEASTPAAASITPVIRVVS